MFAEGYFNHVAEALLFGATPAGQAPGEDVERQRALWSGVVERITARLGVVPGRAGAAPPRWLDVGFGNGSLVFTAAEWGYRPLGLDLRASSVAALQALGFEARCCGIMEIEEASAFQVVSLADVLEHLAFPRPALERAFTLLAPRGLLFISTPNTDSAVWRALDAQQSNPYWGELEHYHCFSRTRLYALLEECGFEPLHYDVSARYRCGMDVIARKR